MSKQLLFVGMAGGLAAAIGLALVFSAVFTQSTAQMMGNQGMMGSGMMTAQSSGTPWEWNQSTFNANGMSNVDSVQITGISITGNNEVTVNLRHIGSETSPALTIIAMTDRMPIINGYSGMGGMGMMHGGQNGMMMQPMMGGWDTSPSWQNNTQWQQWHAQMEQWHGKLDSTQWAQMQAWHNTMMAQGAMGPGNPWWNATSNASSGQSTSFQSQTGSSVLEAGWTSSSVIVRLEGVGSALDSKDVQVMVFPLTS